MKLKNILSIMLLALGMQQVKAEDGNKYLDVHRTDATNSYELAAVKKIVFQQDNTIILIGQEEITIPSAQMNKIAFSSIGTSIDKIPMKEHGLQFVKGEIKVQKAGLLRVYNIAGAMVGAVKVNDNATVSLHTLPAGTYVVAHGNKTIKINKK